MHDKAALRLHRAAPEHDRFVGEALVLEFHLFHYLAELEIGWAIDDQADRTVIAVLAEQGNGVREVLVVETRHRDQELMLQVVLVAHGRSIGKRCAGDKRRDRKSTRLNSSH